MILAVAGNPLLLPHPSHSRPTHEGKTTRIEMRGCKTGAVVMTRYSPATSALLQSSRSKKPAQFQEAFLKHCLSPPAHLRLYYLFHECLIPRPFPQLPGEFQTQGTAFDAFRWNPSDALKSCVLGTIVRARALPFYPRTDSE